MNMWLVLPTGTAVMELLGAVKSLREKVCGVYKYSVCNNESLATVSVPKKCAGLRNILVSVSKHVPFKWCVVAAQSLRKVCEIHVIHNEPKRPAHRSADMIYSNTPSCALRLKSPDEWNSCSNCCCWQQRIHPKSSPSLMCSNCTAFPVRFSERCIHSDDPLTSATSDSVWGFMWMLADIDMMRCQV